MSDDFQWRNEGADRTIVLHCISKFAGYRRQPGLRGTLFLLIQRTVEKGADDHYVE
jgi:hypothetical protein